MEEQLEGIDGSFDISISYRRQLSLLLEDIRDIRDQGKKAGKDPTQVLLFKAMHSTLVSTYEKLNSVYNDLCDMVDNSGSSVAQASDHLVRSSAKRYLHETNALLLAIESEQPPPKISTSNSFLYGSRARAKLPTISLPSFSGNRSEWPRFRDLFESLVIGDDELKNVDRFHYLVASLENPAASIIANFPINEANFAIAWKTLTDTYNNKRLLASTYLDELLSIKPFERKPTANILSERIALLAKNIAAFKLLDIDEPSEHIFFYLACRGLDPDTRMAFENSNNSEFPKVDSLIQFLRKRCAASELASSPLSPSTSKPTSHTSQFKSHKPAGGQYVLLNNAITKQRSHEGNFSTQSISRSGSESPVKGASASCPVCSLNHLLSQCPKFISSSVDERHKLLTGWRGCRNCLRSEHPTRICTSRFRCRVCKGKHNSYLHTHSSSGNDNNITQNPTFKSSAPIREQVFITKTQALPSSSKKSAALNSTSTFPIEILLGTAICRLGASIPSLPVRLVIDSGSHFSFVTVECAQRLGLVVEPHSSDICGIGETPLVGFKGQAHCTLSPLRSRNPRLSLTAIVVDKITSSLPGFDTPSELWQPYHKYELADPQFCVTSPVDFLLGCDLFGEILTGQIITIKPDMPKLLGTIFGYAVIGRIKDLTEAEHIVSLHTATSRPNDDLDNELQRFWALEEPPLSKKLNPEDEQCESLFRETHYRLPSGRYGIRLPFKTAQPILMGSRGIALRRLSHLESKLARNTLLKDKYHEFLREYLNLGHMSLALRPGKAFIPHHCVTKDAGADMKIRVVFDAAARTSDGSLNDFLMAGPKLQTNQVIILLNFRLHMYVFTADAVKMFRQIEVHEDDRLYQHILWRFNVDEPVQEYELNTLSYGQTCAPFQAIRTIHQLVEDEGKSFPLAIRALLEDIYVDDIATGSSDMKGTIELLHQVVGLMSKGGFSLSKWAANHPALLEVARECSPQGVVAPPEPVSLESSTENPSVKILGLQWNSLTDELSYKILPPPLVFTKRSVLSAVAKIYDPLGYLGPTVVLAKILVQEAWKLRLAWDEVFPPFLVEKWRNLISQLPQLSGLRINRWVLPTGTSRIRLLFFADASEKAYCSAVYLHCTTADTSQTHLILAKTKLAPVKVLTIPRLELCAALLAARLFESLRPFYKRLPLPFDFLFFTDSSVVLAWLKTPTYRLKTFVANRVEKILQLTDVASWHHVSSSNNPSDLGSRGLLPSDLIDNNLWFHGPPWTKHDPSLWPLTLTTCDPLPSIPEMKSAIGTCALVTDSIKPVLIEWFQGFSKWTRLLRSFCYVLRFSDRLKGVKRVGVLTLSEIRHATTIVIKLIQAHEFYDSLQVDGSHKDIPKNLVSLQPFFSEMGVLMVGGRLRHSGTSCVQKHPILLPAKSHVSRLIAEYYHRVLLHPGPTILLSVLRTKYWIINARSLARSISRACVTCRKLNASPAQPCMGDLPSCRFREGRAFLHVGTDFAGPFIIRESLRRKAPQNKSYLCIFVCLSTKALHLEAVSALSTQAFCAAFDRFTGRRGLPDKVFSDNGTNFVGAHNQLKDLYNWLRQQSIQDEITDYALQHEVEWSFSPPHAPFFGGVWEAGVKSAKRLMSTVYGQNVLTFEELSTLFIRIEAILNSRPLCPLSSDPCDFNYLSPGHFLIGSPLLAAPEPSLVDQPENRLSRWQLVCQKAQHFWKRWRSEYVSLLQERTKWKFPAYNLQIGDLVIIKEEQAPRLKWPIGRVVDIHPGSDGTVRVASVRTTHSLYKRPSNKLIPLFLPESSSS